MEFPNFVSEEGAENLKQYKYNGIDNSLCARLFLNSYWEWVVSKVPTWVAPNVLTLSGLIFITIGMVLSIWYAPTYVEPVPQGTILLYAVLVFLYQTADNIDGKQARRTKTGSPLGELFDHGVDAIVMGFTMMMVSSVLRGGAISSIIVSVLGIAAYWFSHWEEYHVGVLVMGELTGPTELNIYEICLYLFCALFGTSFFFTPVFGSDVITIATLLQVAFSLASLAAIGRNIVGVYTCIKEGRDAHGCTSFAEAMMQTAAHVAFMAGGIAWALLTPQTATAYPVWYVFTITMGSAYMSQRLITQRVCREPIKQVVSPLIFLALAVVNSAIEYLSFPFFIDSTFILILMFASTLTIEAVFAVAIVKQMCAILHIHPFTVNTAAAAAAAAASAASPSGPSTHTSNVTRSTNRDEIQLEDVSVIDVDNN